ncbi:hypothetical protein [Bilophila wadsworthia]|uniref:hypothetical protein n=1 Tax=Bilophila wadsworthia TaxID=35833 RepID=UPI00266DD39C|nr:hypothetical protein [Bilophila wadsworthia]
MNTSATGGFLQPETGLARSDIERLIGDVIAGITGLPRDLVRERIAVPQADPETGATWCSFGITKRSESKSQVRHYETEDGQGMSRVLTLETLTVPASFFGPACGASHFPEPRTALARQHRAGAGRGCDHASGFLRTRRT